MTKKTNISIIGDGAWGTALALVLHRAGQNAAIWGHEPAYLDAMREQRVNSRFLPGIPIPSEIRFLPDLGEALAHADVAVCAVPSKFLRSVFSNAAGLLKQGATVVSLTKGLEEETLLRPSQLLEQFLETRNIAALSGPSHAEEVARNLPASLVSAAVNVETARFVQHVFSTPNFRVYASSDLIGVEVAGAAKNVIALAAGIVHGLGLGDNALAALATRGLAEMSRLGTALGGEAQTFAGLAGMGDLITTCISPHGRNRAVGIALAEGKSLEQILAAIPGVPEGVTTTRSLLSLAKRIEVDMPITAQAEMVVWEGKDPRQAVADLMTRARKDED